MQQLYHLVALLGLFSAAVIMVESNGSEGGEIYAACNVEKYSNGSAFDCNLQELLKTLREKAAYTGFGASVHVYRQDGPNQLSGRLQCRGDLSPAECQACSSQAMKVVHRDCPNAIGARVQLDHCFVRYENYTFLSQLDTNVWYDLVNVNTNIDIQFNDGVRDLMADLSSRAPASPIKFALGSSIVSSNLTIYGMEMCWRDMSTKDCAACLSKGYQDIFNLSTERLGAHLFLGSCTLRYEIYPFANHY